MDKVFIDHLEIYCTIGVYEWEKQITQKLIIDLEMDFDNQAAGEQDDINLALDYSTVSKRVTDMIRSEPIQLVEAVAERVAQLLLTEFPILRVRVKVMKPGAVVNARCVGVEIVREA